MLTRAAILFALAFVLSLFSCVLFIHRTRRRRGARVPAAFLLGAASLFFCLFAAEVAVPFLVNDQVLRTLSTQRLLDEDPLLDFKWKKNAGGFFISPEFFVPVKTNPRRLRNPEAALGKVPDGPLRLLILGDSFAAGYGVAEEKSFAGILRERLAGRAEVVNAGVNGYGPLHELMYYHVEGRGYRPDAVLLCFYPNDLMDGLYLPLEAFNDTGVDLARVDAFIRDSSYRFTDMRLQSGPPPGNLAGLAGQALGLFHLRRHFSYQDIINGRSDLSVFLKNPQRPLASRWRANLRLVRQLAELCRKDGIGFALAAIPMWVQVHPEDWRPFASGAGLSAELVDMRQPQELVAGLARELDVPFLDALPEMRRAGAAERLYFRRDDHLNPAGHAALAEFLLQNEELIFGSRPGNE